MRQAYDYWQDQPGICRRTSGNTTDTIHTPTNEAAKMQQLAQFEMETDQSQGINPAELASLSPHAICNKTTQLTSAFLVVVVLPKNATEVERIQIFFLWKK